MRNVLLSSQQQSLTLNDHTVLPGSPKMSHCLRTFPKKGITKQDLLYPHVFLVVNTRQSGSAIVPLHLLR